MAFLLNCVKWVFMRERERDTPLVGGDFFNNYEAKLKRAKALACITNVMYSFNWFLGFCALTWASAVILGGYVTELSQADYFSAVMLLLLEAVRLSTATFFGKFVSWNLVHGSTDPGRLIYNDATKQKLQGIARIFEQAIQFTVVGISILVPIRRLQDLKLLSSPFHVTTTANKFDGLKTSLHIFYALVLVNGAIAGLAVIFSTNVVPFIADSPCLRKYYEAVVWKGIDEGLLHSTDFDMLSWAFKIQADEYRRNIRAPVVKDLYGDMLKFLYYHPRNKGFEAAKVALESDDTFEREAAANIVGLWVMQVKESNDEDALSRLLMQKKLLAKLAEALDNDESGRAASLSFEKLAEKGAEVILGVRSEGGNVELADIFMDRIHEAVKLKKPNKVLTDIKVMIPILRFLRSQNNPMPNDLTSPSNRDQLQKYCTWNKLVMLKADMWTLVTDHKNVFKRLQAVAAYAHNLLDEDTDLCSILRVKPQCNDKQYLLKDEAAYLYKLLDVTELPGEWNPSGSPSPRVTVRDVEDDRRKPLPWLARRSTALVASFVNLSILVVCAIFIMRYAHF